MVSIQGSSTQDKSAISQENLERCLVEVGCVKLGYEQSERGRESAWVIPQSGIRFAVLVFPEDFVLLQSHAILSTTGFSAETLEAVGYALVRRFNEQFLRTKWMSTVSPDALLRLTARLVLDQALFSDQTMCQKPLIHWTAEIGLALQLSMQMLVSMQRPLDPQTQPEDTENGALEDWHDTNTSGWTIH
jgi:hypothetical protein